MRGAIPAALIVASLVAISVALAGIASTFALADRASSELEADLASRIRADYSADPAGTTLAPLDEGLLESAREDEDTLDQPSDAVEISNSGAASAKLTSSSNAADSLVTGRCW